MSFIIPVSSLCASLAIVVRLSLTTKMAIGRSQTRFRVVLKLGVWHIFAPKRIYLKRAFSGLLARLIDSFHLTNAPRAEPEVSLVYPPPKLTGGLGLVYPPPKLTGGGLSRGTHIPGYTIGYMLLPKAA
jgi:hypothetical protein